ncbi:hypothetical protein VOLCADRAFT_117895, partial [Volvox carteri f. nagariensis]
MARRGSAPSTAAVGPRVASGPRKLTHSQLAAQLHGQLTDVLRMEWRRIKTSNLGVLSGTAVVEELLLRRIRSWCSELHMLAISSPTASYKLGKLCQSMEGTELQQLLVMFDQTGHPDLSDFVRVLVFNTADPAAKEAVGDLRALRGIKSAGRRARSTPSTSGSSRRRAPPVLLPTPRTVSHEPDDPASLRFAGLLPEGHRLVAGAHAAAERRRQREEDERRAAEAREARARARFEAAGGRRRLGLHCDRRLSDSSSWSSVLRSRSDKQELLPYYLADVEEQWRRTVATRVPAEGVYDSVIMSHEALPVYESMPDAALVRREAEEAAAAPPSRHGLAAGSVNARAAQPFSGLFNTFGSGGGAAGGGGGGRPNGGSGTAAAASGPRRITSGRPGSGRGPQLLPPGGDHSSTSTAGGGPPS